MSTTHAAARYNALHAPTDLPPGLLFDIPNLTASTASATFVEATRQIQHRLGLKVDGFFGPDTLDAVRARYPEDRAQLPPLETWPVRRARRSLLFCDFALPRIPEAGQWAEEIAQVGATHAAIGVNNVSVVKKSGAFQLTGAAADTPRLESACKALSARGVQPLLQVWMHARGRFVDEAARVVGRLCQVVGADPLANAEEDWVGEKGEDHDRLADRFVDACEGMGLPVWSAVLYYKPRAVRRLVMRSHAVSVEVLSFRRPSRPATMKDDWLPGILQVRGADVWREELESPRGPLLFWQQATYDQAYEGVPDHVSMRAAACASLGAVPEERYERHGNVAWWSRGNAWKKMERRQVIASFAPRREP